MRILVTGSAGHLGEGLMRTLAHSEHDAVGLDIKESQFTQRVGSIAERALKVAANITSLGGRALLVGLRGEDESGGELERVLRTSGVAPEHLVPTRERATTTKLRSPRPAGPAITSSMKMRMSAEAIGLATE